MDAVGDIARLNPATVCLMVAGPQPLFKNLAEAGVATPRALWQT
jgi:hypothetical protein